MKNLVEACGICFTCIDENRKDIASTRRCLNCDASLSYSKVLYAENAFKLSEHYKNKTINRKIILELSSVSQEDLPAHEQIKKINKEKTKKK